MKRFLMAALLAVVGAVAIVSAALRSSYQGFAEPVRITFMRGTGTREMAHALANAGVIQAPWMFLAQRALDSSAKLQAGEYEFTKPASVREVFQRIARGDIYHFPFTVPEGSNIFDIAKLVDERGLAPSADFIKAAQDPTPIRDLDPEAKSLEGYLFPSTYQLTTGVTTSQLVQMMTAEFKKQWSKLSQANPHKTVTLASLVEKETGAGGERKLVASVFANRLKREMHLDCDPTVIYASILAGKYNGVIHRSDLDRESPYNTYKSAGLPPGPIANPGTAAIEAALHPAETDYLFFVAKPEGGSHAFSSSITAHNRAVADYRRAEQGKAH